MALHLAEIVRNQALVAQEPVLFNTSVRQNLLYGLPHCHIDSDPKDEMYAMFSELQTI